ncbi:MAG: hypothetical protein JO366_05520 [Methylobacteriaceae bacterium]|nr:hypothetical protein [Methylobacteriaceae bacterium]MBV9244252.1 hypothetical protein [Methylobacteriaceae bacterium]
MNPYRYTVSLRIWHPRKTPTEVEKGLGLKARVAHQVGARRKTSDGTDLAGNYPQTYCSFRLGKGDSEDFLEAIHESNRKLISYSNYIRELRRTGGRAEYFVGLFMEGNGGFILPYDELKSMGEIGIDMSLDIYPAEDSIHDGG